jgi:NADH:ubiquinone oxidoreductase subunit 6 (subunit J)
MLAILVLGVSVIVAVVAALSVFRAKEMSHAMVGFLFVSVSTAALLALLGLPLLALLQLFIMVGGVSTYLFVGVSSENLSRFRHTSFPVLFILAICLAVVPVYKVLAAGTASPVTGALGSATIAAGISGNLALFYMLGVLLFGIGIASIVMMRSFRKGGRK